MVLFFVAVAVAVGLGLALFFVAGVALGDGVAEAPAVVLPSAPRAPAAPAGADPPPPSSAQPTPTMVDAGRTAPPTASAGK